MIRFFRHRINFLFQRQQQNASSSWVIYLAVIFFVLELKTIIPGTTCAFFFNTWSKSVPHFGQIVSYIHSNLINSVCSWFIRACFSLIWAVNLSLLLKNGDCASQTFDSHAHWCSRVDYNMVGLALQALYKLNIKLNIFSCYGLLIVFIFVVIR